MTASDVSVKKIEKVAFEYEKNASDFSKTQRERDFVAGNPFARKLGKAAIQLRHQLGSGGRAALYKLLNHEDTIVRKLAAYDCLDFSPKAETVLMEIARGDKFEGAMAAWVLEQWRSGKRDFPGGGVTLNPDESYP